MDTEDSDTQSSLIIRMIVPEVSKLPKVWIFSHDHYILDRRWKIKVKKNDNYLSVYLHHDKSAMDPIYVVCECRLLPTKPKQEPLIRQFKHLFAAQYNWGYQEFISNDELLASNYISDDLITLEMELEVEVSVTASNCRTWDSKKHTGFVGLKEQNQIPFLNPLIQTLYFISKFRNAVYRTDVDLTDHTEIESCLKILFSNLQYSQVAVDTDNFLSVLHKKKLVSFEKLTSFKHFFEKFLHVLINNSNDFIDMFKCRSISYVMLDCDEYVSKQPKEFYLIEIQIDDDSNRDVYQLLKNYFNEQTYSGGIKKKCKLLHCPPILFVHLIIPSNKKTMRFKFQNNISLNGLEDESDSCDLLNYTLFSVFSVNEDNQQVAYINPKCDDGWFRFVNGTVCKCTLSTVEKYSFNECHYMFVYAKHSEIDQIIKKVDESLNVRTENANII